MTTSGDDTDLYRLAQRAHVLLETLHTVVYFAPEPVAEYRAYGLRGRAGYFASRSAAMGPVPAEVIAATFAIFSPRFIATCMDGVWARVSPGEIQAARRRGAEAALMPVLGDFDLIEALTLAQVACGGLDGLGRALYSAHAALEWPGTTTMDLWHAATLLREHRGDGHFAAVLLSGLGPVETMVLHGAVTTMRPFLQTTRGWADADWVAAEDALGAAGLVTVAEPDRRIELTAAGRELKSDLERRTRLAALAGWRRLGLAGTGRLVELLEPVRQALLATEIFPPGSPLRG